KFLCKRRKIKPLNQKLRSKFLFFGLLGDRLFGRIFLTEALGRAEDKK
ncbi:hypothetical protein C5S42_00995, partial [Candidatus Methanomarinus sp.]